MDQCLCCKDAVTEHDAALQCEMCLGWQHLACNTDVSRRTYRRAVRGTVEIQWNCATCSEAMVCILFIIIIDSCIY